MWRRLVLAASAAAALCGDAYADVSLKLGVLNDRSGIYFDLAGEGSVIAARMAVEDFKAAEKGINVEIVSADHQNKADIGSNIARQWYDQDNVDAIVDVPNSSVALAINEITREKNKVFLNAGGAASVLSGAQCSPNTVHFSNDTRSLAYGTGSALVKQGGDTWFFISADNAFGHVMEEDTTTVVVKNGGKVVGSVRHPFPGNDFSSFLLQAQASGAKVIALANAGGDAINSIKQASEFGVIQGGQRLAGLIVSMIDVHGIGLQDAQGLTVTESFYWDLNDDTRAWSARFAALDEGKMPTMVHAGVYSAVTHYLKAVEASQSKDPAIVIAKMEELPTNDPVFGKGMVRKDGRHVHDMFLFQVKTPEESTGEWDIYKQLATIPAGEAFQPLSESDCPLVKQ